MATFKIEGGHELKGEITPQGAKNEALQVICACLLTKETVTINNIPDILDVKNLISLINSIGVIVTQISKNSYSFKAENINLEYLKTDEYNKASSSLRGSVMMLGPLLARYGYINLPKPGGDKIGSRRLDTHFLGFEKLGVKFSYSNETKVYEASVEELKGTFIHLDEASVTGTANVIMAAVMAKGKTTIYNAACEPYIQQLCKMLNSMGAKITGISSNLLTIEGVEELHGTTHNILPDMIEIGSFIGMAAMTGSEITIKNVNYDMLGIIPQAFRKLGIKIELNNDDIIIPKQSHYEIETFIDGSIMTIADAIWPGLTPDLLSIFLVVATQAKGTVLIHQKMSESRFFFIDSLSAMGAQLILCDPHRATIIGLNREKQLLGTTMQSPDIRAGMALLIAALSAKGNSIIKNIEQIDRGYEQIDVRLNKLGAKIERI